MEEQIRQIISALAQGDELAQQLAASLVQAVLQLDESAMQVAQAIMELAQSGDQEAQVAAQTIQMVAEAMQGGGNLPAPEQVEQAQMARLGTKLNYVKYLRGQCPSGYEMQMFRKGGAVCKKCIKKKEEGGQAPQMAKKGSVIEEFRCGRKMKTKKAECGTKVKKKVAKAQMGINTGAIVDAHAKAHPNAGMGVAIREAFYPSYRNPFAKRFSEKLIMKNRRPLYQWIRNNGLNGVSQLKRDKNGLIYAETIDPNGSPIPNIEYIPGVQYNSAPAPTLDY